MRILRNNVSLKTRKESSVLIVDDDQVILDIFQRALKNLEIKTATNGKDALEILESCWKPDVILMDIRMPEMDGIQATKLIREKNKDIIIIGISAYGGELEEQMRKAGANEFLRKPLRMKKLQEIVNNYCL